MTSEKHGFHPLQEMTEKFVWVQDAGLSLVCYRLDSGLQGLRQVDVFVNPVILIAQW